MKLKFYHFPGACSRVTLNALEEAGLEYEDQVVNILEGEQKSPEYLKIHRSGKVPALDVDGQILTENVAMISMLNELHPEAGLLPEVESPLERATQISDLVWCTGTVHPAVRQVRMPVRYTDGDTSGVQAKGHELVTAIAEHVDARVANGKWWYGETWSIVDVYLWWLFLMARLGGFALDGYTNIVDLMQRVEERPSFQQAAARETAAKEAAGIEFPR